MIYLGLISDPLAINSRRVDADTRDHMDGWLVYYNSKLRGCLHSRDSRLFAFEQRLDATLSPSCEFIDPPAAPPAVSRPNARHRRRTVCPGQPVTSALSRRRQS